MVRKYLLASSVAAALVIAPLSNASANDHFHGRGIGLLGAAVIGTTAAILAAPLVIAAGGQPVAPMPYYGGPGYYPPPVVYVGPGYYGHPYGGYYYRHR